MTSSELVPCICDAMSWYTIRITEDDAFTGLIHFCANCNTYDASKYYGNMTDAELENVVRSNAHKVNAPAEEAAGFLAFKAKVQADRDATWAYLWVAIEFEKTLMQSSARAEDIVRHALNLAALERVADLVKETEDDGDK